MTLRWRLALSLALLAGLATAATASIAYRNTSDRLNHEVDRFLADRLPLSPGRGRNSLAAELAEHGPGQIVGRRGGMGPPVPGMPGYPRRANSNAPAGEAPPSGTEGSVPPAGAGTDLAPRDDTIVQVVLSDGTVAAGSAPVVLPVDSGDLAVANGSSASPYTRTVTVAGTPYRVRTVSWEGGGAIQVARDTSDIQRVLSELRWRFVAVGLSVMAAAMIAGWFIARRTTAPLQRLTGAAETVARTGDLTTPIPTAGADETGRLARAFATMLAALNRSRAVQTQLVQDASHELRTPLTSLRTNIEVLERHPDLNPELRGALFDDLRSELHELGALVGELVELASDNRDDEPVSDVHLDDLVGHAAERAGRRHGRHVVVTGVGSTVTGRRGALERALSNLLDNAAKFSPAGTPIEVSVDGARVEVHDHGPGIPANDLGRVFDRFYRSAHARQLPGSGLGLAIVAQVVEGHGGRVFAANHPDGGAIVGFELPVG